MELNFRSDNESPAAPAIMAALVDANHGTAMTPLDAIILF
jgi:threonine aldolase